jgi:histidinol-phosphatase
VSFEQELEVARAVAMAAGELALEHQRRGVSPEAKPDLSPVTIADKESERLIVERIRQAFPADGILGEEGSDAGGSSGRRWIIDPIDGTRDFLRGLPLWAIMIGLEQDGEVVAGVSHMPARGETYWAARGQGAWCNGTQLHASNRSSAAEAVLCINEMNYLARQPWGAKVLDWTSHFWSVRSLGGSLDAVMLASGRVDIWVEPRAKAWDLAPYWILFSEAGVEALNFDGGSSIYGGSCIGYAPGLEGAVRELLDLVNE